MTVDSHFFYGKSQLSHYYAPLLCTRFVYCNSTCRELMHPLRPGQKSALLSRRVVRVAGVMPKGKSGMYSKIPMSGMRVQNPNVRYACTKNHTLHIIHCQKSIKTWIKEVEPKLSNFTVELLEGGISSMMVKKVLEFNVFAHLRSVQVY